MRIGILTFHRAHNYGAVLQCYALQTYLQEQEHQVNVIDYYPSHFFNFYNWFQPQLLRVRNPFEFVRRIKLINNKRKRHQAFARFIEQKLNLCPVSEIFEHPFDVIVVGSDQVWNTVNGFDPFYWGAIKLPAQTRLISYAASMPDKLEPEKAQLVRDMLDNFDAISVREASLKNILTELTGKQQISQVLDPTVLLHTSDWQQLSSKRIIPKPYLLLYLVQYKPEVERIARQIAAERHLELIYITPDVDSKTSPSVYGASPEDFVSLFQYADFVVSASFHGTVFALQFGRPFLSFRMGIGRDSRVASLLEPLGMAHHFTDSYDPSADYTCHLEKSRLEALRSLSYKYLEDSVQENAK